MTRKFAADAMRGVSIAVLFLAFEAAGSLEAAAQDSTQIACSAAGRNYQPGEVACIPACHGAQQLAKCEQTGSGVKWTNIANSCPNASLPKPQLFSQADTDFMARLKDG